MPACCRRAEQGWWWRRWRGWCHHCLHSVTALSGGERQALRTVQGCGVIRLLRRWRNSTVHWWTVGADESCSSSHRRHQPKTEGAASIRPHLPLLVQIRCKLFTCWRVHCSSVAFRDNDLLRFKRRSWRNGAVPTLLAGSWYTHHNVTCSLYHTHTSWQCVLVWLMTGSIRAALSQLSHDIWWLPLSLPAFLCLSPSVRFLCFLLWSCSSLCYV